MDTLVDTNVLSELLRDPPNPCVFAWFASQATSGLFVSTVTQAEMLLGARLLPAGKRRARLQACLEGLFASDFEGRLWPFDSRAAAVYAEVVSTRRASGRPISQFDAQIAAIALSRGARLATRNTDDFEGFGLPLHNPWLVS